MAGKFPGKVYQREGAGRFGKERRDGGDSDLLELWGASLDSRRPALAWKRETRSPAQFVPPPPAAPGSVPSEKNAAPAEGRRGQEKA
ncbi:hypothetical protein MC885_010254, partial [Smutsia gigantea]